MLNTVCMHCVHVHGKYPLLAAIELTILMTCSSQEETSYIKEKSESVYIEWKQPIRWVNISFPVAIFMLMQYGRRG